MDATELAGMRTEAERLLTDTLTIKRATSSSDGELGYTRTWATAAANVPCSVVELGLGRGEREAIVTGASRSTGEYMVRLPIGTDARLADRLEWAGNVLEVSRVMTRTRAALLSVLATEIE